MLCELVQLYARPNMQAVVIRTSLCIPTTSPSGCDFTLAPALGQPLRSHASDCQTCPASEAFDTASRVVQ